MNNETCLIPVSQLSTGSRPTIAAQFPAAPNSLLPLEQSWWRSTSSYCVLPSSGATQTRSIKIYYVPNQTSINTLPMGFMGQPVLALLSSIGRWDHDGSCNDMRKSATKKRSHWVQSPRNSPCCLLDAPSSWTKSGKTSSSQEGWTT